MNKYIIFATFIASFVVIGVVRRTSRTRKGNVAAQLLGGLNVFAAALLAWMTLVTLFMALNNNLGLPDAFLNWSSVTFVIVIDRKSVVWSLLRARRNSDSRFSYVLCTHTGLVGITYSGRCCGTAVVCYPYVTDCVHFVGNWSYPNFQIGI